jgi:hypothetical protein
MLFFDGKDALAALDAFFIQKLILPLVEFFF